MKRTKLLTTCLTLGVAITGCDKPPIREAATEAARRTTASDQQRDPKVAARIRKEVGDILQKPPASIKETDAFVKDLGADSLDTVEIVMAVEDAFNIAIADEDAEKLITVGDLIDYVAAKIKAAPAKPEKSAPPESGAYSSPSADEEQVAITVTYIKTGSGTEDLDFGWLVNPFAEAATSDKP